VLKFSDIISNAPEMKVFSVGLGSTVVIQSLDIFNSLWSRMLPWDEFVEFDIKNGELSYNVTPSLLLEQSHQGRNQRRFYCDFLL